MTLTLIETPLESYEVWVQVIPRRKETRSQQHYTVKARNVEHAIELGRQEACEEGFELPPYHPPKTPAEALSTFAIKCGASSDAPQRHDLHEFLKELSDTILPTEGNGYCVGSNSYSFEQRDQALTEGRKLPTYSSWEIEVANPALIAAGFELLWCWTDGERDSFGPLSRCIQAKKDGIFYEFSYG